MRDALALVGAHRVDERAEHVDGVVDDALVARVRPVQQPAGDLELGVEERPLLELAVDRHVVRLVVGAEDALGDVLGARAQHPVQVVSGVRDPQLRPADHARHVVAGDEERGGLHGAVHDGRLELPERRVVERLLPAREQQARHERGGGSPVDEGRGLAVDLRGREHGQPRVGDEPGRQAVHGGDGGADGAREAVARGDLVERDDAAGHVAVDEAAGRLDGRLPQELGHLERQPRADPGAQRPQRDEVRGLLGLGGLRGRHAHEELAAVPRGEERGVEVARAACRERGAADHVEPRDGRGRQRG